MRRSTTQGWPALQCIQDRKRLKEKLKVALRSRALNDEAEARRSTTTQDWPAEERLVGQREVLFGAMGSRGSPDAMQHDTRLARPAVHTATGSRRRSR